eukprot:TRINITY_DN2864_c0_g2_i1.p1 TRINITY_DN2864_c0_g2~~TRINITY_DN2864_c0_g2_i1.p1  ORF type:complete len:747 (+),score=247.11 TRINITY_DN2864_c0_g2_i1:95-2335(+)
MEDLVDSCKLLSNLAKKAVQNQRYCQVLVQRLEAVVDDLKEVKYEDLKPRETNKLRKVIDDAQDLIKSCQTNNWLRFVYGAPASEQFKGLSERLASCCSDMKLSTNIDSVFSYRQDDECESALRSALEEEISKFETNSEETVFKLLQEHFKSELPAIRSKLLQLGKKSSLTSMESKLKAVLEKVLEASSSELKKFSQSNSVPILKDNPAIAAIKENAGSSSRSSSSSSPLTPSAPPPATLTVSGVSYEEIQWDELEIISQVGVGAFAEVFEALRHGERVAVKKLISQDNVKAIKELEYEVNLMASFHSGYIVTLYGACFKKPNMCMVMEYLPGGSLNHLLYDITIEIPWERRWAYARDTALGLNYLHSRKPAIVHRDLKSGNLLLTADGRVKITDFGLSKLKDATMEGEESFQGGTDRWTAPEIGDGEKYTEAADVFSYGVILYEIAARKLPFHDVPAENVRALWKKGDRPSIPDDTPPDFEKLIKMCWDQRPRSRPSFQDVIQYLRKKGKITTISTEKSQGRYSDEKEKLERENEILSQLKETLEKKRDEAERVAEREKKRRIELEAQYEESESKLKEERNKRAGLEKDVQDLSRSLRVEIDKAKQLEDARKDSEKKAQKLRKKTEAESKEELLRATEESDKRIAEERAKVARLREQTDVLEKKITEEEQKRSDVEKKLKQALLEVEEQRKKTDDVQREKEQIDKKLAQEKKKVAQEKKRREELEVELEEEQKKSRRRAAGTTTR